MIAMREEEIRNFKPEDYYGVTLQAEGVQWIWKDAKSGGTRTFHKEKAEEIRDKAGHSSLEITSVTRKPKKVPAPGLYDLTTLQREANQKYGFSAKETLNIMQRLYENHKVLTYPRTDSRYIGKDVVPTIKERLKACGVGPYRKLAGVLLTRPIQTNGSFVDDKKVSGPSRDHPYGAVCAAGSYDQRGTEDIRYGCPPFPERTLSAFCI